VLPYHILIYKKPRIKTPFPIRQPILTRSAMEDVVMTDAYPAKYKRSIPIVQWSNGGDVESFINKLKRYFG